MDFDLSDDQEALQQAAANLLDAQASMEKVRQASERPDRFDRELWARMAEQGWLAVERSEAAGGLEMGLVEVAILAEQLGRHLAPVPFAGTVLALGALERATKTPAGAQNADQLNELVDRLAAGDAIGAVAWCRRPGQVTAERSGAGDGSGWALTGRPDAVIFGPVADVVIVPAIAAGETEPALFAVLVPEGSAPAPESAMDLTRSLGWLELDASPALLIGDAAACAELGDRAAVVASAEMLGSAQRVLDMSVQYAKDRVQFGRPIGSFQAVKHRCADMLVDVEGMKSVVYYAAWCVAAGNPDAPAAASAAKIWCSEAASRVMASGLQVHGGIGFTWEHDLHLFVKRSQLDQVSFGTTLWHKDRLAAILRPLAEAGLPVM